MKANQAEFPVRAMCRVLDLSPSGYYAWLKRAPSAHARRDIELVKKIRAIFDGNRKVYGRPKIFADLKEQGEAVGAKRVGRLMKQAGIRGVSRRRRGPTTIRRRADARPAPDLVERDFTADGPDQLWVADITYIPTWAGFLYLAVVVDVWSRRVIGWSMANHLRTELVLDAMNMAVYQRRPERVIHHSDQGTQGGFKRSSQHFHNMEELRWARRSAGGWIELSDRGCVPQVVRPWDVASTGRGSGRKSLAVCRARRRLWRRACLPLWGPGGSANVVVCHPSSFVPSRSATCRSSSEKRSLFSEPEVVACGPLPGSWGAHPRRSRESCVGTRRREVGTSSTGRRRPSGTRPGERSDRRSASSRRTRS